ncbi:MAG: [FeFe] hydrogenase H-cluster maturation GTPase HydF [Burkholderiales bacterium]|nr:[FeFe] hydrogenase H-cluster maturation GTPase HydF [Burkholderiales bacterium]
MAGIQETPKANRVHIGIFGRRNAGKSSLFNKLTKQNAALVSETPGTTTDPVYKAMEILPLGPVMIIDTAGIDDVGDLGKLRVGKTKEAMTKTDLAIVVLDAAESLTDFETTLFKEFKELGTEVILAVNKVDSSEYSDERIKRLVDLTGLEVLPISTLTGSGMTELMDAIVKLAPRAFEDPPLLRDLLKPGDTVILCVPVDTGAPKGRLILPQVQAIRDALDAGASVIVAKENEIENQLANLKKPPALAITDSQAFAKANQTVGKEIPLTSFSILMARQKGDLVTLAEGAEIIDQLKPGDKVLIAEACTHRCQAEDIGRIKIPKMLQKRIGGKLDFTWYTGNSFPEDVAPYKLVIHCGACMLTRRAMLQRQRQCREAGIPMVNYGVTLAKLTGVLDRAMIPVKDALTR